MHRRDFCLGALATSLIAPAGAQGKTIRIIVPYAAGGPIDVTARAGIGRARER